MNHNALKCLFKVALNTNYINTCRPALVSACFLHNKFTPSHICQKNFSATNYVSEVPFFESVRNYIKLQFRKHKLRASGYYLYECIADQLDYNKFIKLLDLPDTFNSWFLVTELHVWMLMARLMGDPKYGRFTRNSLVEALWKDVDARAKKLGSEHRSVINSQIKELSEEFQAALVNYDEGILSDDTILAGALWRRLLNRKCTPQQLEGMVKYVRQNMFLLDKLGSEEFFLERSIKWLNIDEVNKSLPT